MITFSQEKYKRIYLAPHLVDDFSPKALCLYSILDAPTAAVVGNVIMLEQSSVWFGATVRGDNPEPITIGER